MKFRIFRKIMSSLTTHDELLRSAILTNIARTFMKQSEVSEESIHED